MRREQGYVSTFAQEVSQVNLGQTHASYGRSPPINSSYVVIGNLVYLPSSLPKALRMPCQFWNSTYRMTCRLAYSTDCRPSFSHITVSSVCTGEALLTTHLSRGSLSFSFQPYPTHTKCMLPNCSLRLDSRETTRHLICAVLSLACDVY